ncbi:TPA: YadA-like family protein, partial [Salmonella enterica]|nr:YadA-like family protein [Salmonella enterica]HDC1932040.1 YadA-like family protein [Salmonella enterica]
VTVSENYTDSKITENNAVINKYAESRINNMAGASTAYTDSRYEQSINYAQNAANNAENNANNYTDNRFNQLHNSTSLRFKQLDEKINRTEKRLSAGVAGVAAISSIPYVAENSFSYGIGIGNYQNGNALAAGIQYKTSPNTNVRLNVSWDSSNNTVLGAGLAGGW